MDEIKMHEAIDHDRRRFFSAAALSFTAAELGVIGAAHAETQPPTPPAIKTAANASFAPLKQIMQCRILNTQIRERWTPSPLKFPMRQRSRQTLSSCLP